MVRQPDSSHCFIEEAAVRHPSLIINDGFDRRLALSTRFPFAPEQFFDRTYRSGAVYARQAEIPTINLIKLHGSLTWIQTTTGILFRSELRSPLSAAERASPVQVEQALCDRALILPNLRKFESTLMDRVYYDLLRMFSNTMDRDNALLIAFGFSFGDEHILDLTRRALRNPTSQLIVCGYSAAAADDLALKFTSHRNVIVLGPDADENLDFSKLNSLLSDIAPEGSIGRA